jgi:hypothetical protein
LPQAPSRAVMAPAAATATRVRRLTWTPG